MNHVSKFWLGVGVVPLLSILLIAPSDAQTAQPRQQKRTTSAPAHAIPLASQYKQRFDYYSQKIDQGLSSGWLTEVEAESFRSRVTYMKRRADTAQRQSFRGGSAAYLNRTMSKFQAALTAAEKKAGSRATTTTTTTDAAR